MTKSGKIVRKQAEQAHALQGQLSSVAKDAQNLVAPAMNELNCAANASLGDGFSMMNASRAVINADNAEAAAQGQILEELAAFASKFSALFHHLNAPQKTGALLTAEMARGRIKQCAHDVFDITRRDTILEECPALKIMIKEFPNINETLDRIETAGNQCVDKLQQSPLALPSRSSQAALR